MTHKRKLAIGFAAVALALSAAVVLALPRDMVELQYFHDEDMTDYAGMQIMVRCNGSQGPLWGELGEYSIETRSDCREQNVASTCYRNHIQRTYNPDGTYTDVLIMRTEVLCPTS